MKYIKKFEDIKIDKRKGIFVGSDQIFYIIDFLNSRDVRFMLLYGNDDNGGDDLFLVLIEGDDYKKLDYDVSGIDDYHTKDWYIEMDGDNVFLNWFEPENIEGDWQIRNTDKESIRSFINSNKYNI